MNTKRILKIATILVITLIISMIATNVLAVTSPSGITVTDTTQFDSLGGKIIGMIQAIGNIVSIAVLVVLGVKYMMGSAEEKAEYKKTMIPYIVGAVLVFAASNIAGFVAGFASGI